MCSCRLLVVKRFPTIDLAQAFADRITEDGSETVTINPECSFKAVNNDGQTINLTATDYHSALEELAFRLGWAVEPETIQ